MTLLLDTRGLRTRGDRRRSPTGTEASQASTTCSQAPTTPGSSPTAASSTRDATPRLISRELFDQVQAVLQAHCLAGERDRKHQHYLKGTIRCGTCGCRLVYSRHKGNGGPTNTSSAPATNAANAPRATSPSTSLRQPSKTTTPASRSARPNARKSGEAITIDLGERVATAQQEIDRCRGVLREVNEQERKLLHMHYEDRITGELFDDEQPAYATAAKTPKRSSTASTSATTTSTRPSTSPWKSSMKTSTTSTYEPKTASDGSSTRPSSRPSTSATKRSPRPTSPGHSRSYAPSTTTSEASSAPPRTPRQPPQSPARCPKTPRLPSPGGNGSLWTLVRLATFWWS